MPYIEVDVDIDQFDTDDIIDEARRRIDRLKSKPKDLLFNKTAIEELMESINKLPIKLNVKPFSGDTNLADQMKYEYLEELFPAFTESQFMEMVQMYNSNQKRPS
jgi:uncharacterized protein YacL (UPF0231 family)